MATKFYAVKKGLQTGIFNTWDECRNLVNGYPGAKYKSFKTLEEAQEYLGIPIETKKDTVDIITDSSHAIAYVDGSYNINNGLFSYGVVMFHNNKEFHFSNKYDNKELSSMRNVAGEIFGAICAMQYAVQNNVSDLTIYHDYEGISKWCLGLWKTNKKATVAYKNYYDSIKNKVNIKFCKVKGHSGDKYNDLADSLAKKEIF